LVLAEKLAENPGLRGEAFNFSNEVQLSVLELVEHILRLMGSDLEPEVRNEATNEIRHQYLSAEKARRLLDWEAQVDLRDGIAATVEWLREQELAAPGR
jgi:CDP-glucose 4,6-dehydratase